MFDDLKDKVVVTGGVTGIGGAAKFGGSAGSSVYAGSKGLVAAVSKSLAKEFAAAKI